MHGSAKNDLFLSDVMTQILHIINKIQHFSKLSPKYLHYDNNRNSFLMSVLVRIEVLHMSLAEEVLRSNYLAFWRPSWWPSLISQNAQGFKLVLQQICYRWHLKRLNFYSRSRVHLGPPDYNTYQATGLDTRTSRVKCPAQFMSHW